MNHANALGDSSDVIIFNDGTWEYTANSASVDISGRIMTDGSSAIGLIQEVMMLYFSQ